MAESMGQEVQEALMELLRLARRKVQSRRTGKERLKWAQVLISAARAIVVLQKAGLAPDMSMEDLAKLLSALDNEAKKLVRQALEG